MRKLILGLTLACASLAGTTAIAAPSIQAGVEYQVLKNKVPVADESKIEVVEMFWYGCPHCNQLEPFVTNWQKNLPEDVKLVRVPAMFGGVWDIHGQLFLTLEALKVDSQLHSKVFDAIHKERRQLKDYTDIEKFIVEIGVDKDKFSKMWNSFAIKGQMDKARKLALAYQVQGVPVMVVDGQYLFDIGTAGGLQETTQVADQLIDMVRTAKAK
ncbi:thiol:disulfide interchange protein DsbA/DsbL [Pseudomonas sp. F1_0610]|uniref:thiol:disulfide interchange protein DsbA/DsbL n=1 Tax=Pseudomonas sp. F1_0610 TaxID=3114284 RepID=UPI0039C1A415